MATRDKLRSITKDLSSGASTKKGRGRGFQTSARDYTYTVTGECDNGTTAQLVYTLRGSAGRYDEGWCDGELSGTLTYVEDTTVDVEGIQIHGHVYNGTDDTGVYGYLFSSAEVPEVGAFVILIGDEYMQGQEFSAFTGFPATRTSP